MLFLLWGLLVISGVLFPKSKFVSAMMLAFMIITIGFRTQGADYIVYKNEFIWSEYQVFSDVHYVGYLVLEQYAHKWGISFDQFLVLVGSVSCLLTYFGISRLTFKVNAVLALFFIYPFSHEAIQTRTFLANSVLIAALPLILKTPMKKYPKAKGHNKNVSFFQILLFYAFSILACAFHFEAVIYVFFLSLMLFLPPKYGKVYVVGGSTVAFLLIQTGILPKIVERFNSRIAYWLSGKTGLGILIPITISIVIWYAMQITGTVCVRQNAGDNAENSRAQSFYNSILNFSDYILFLIPLFCYDITFNRLWRLFLLLLYVMVVDAFPRNMRKNTRLWIVLLLSVLFVSVCIYEGVFGLLYGFFENNAVFRSLSVL